ncbi:MAG: hypothetical protein KAI47_23635, partial [Deltaproteobacteria bacterium]|nr:hypothetical protein [Deltaproteobacteria bacterium]
MAGLQGLIKARAHTGGKPADPPSPPRIRLILGGISLVLFAIFLGGSALLYRHSLHAPTTIPGILLANHRLGALGDHDLDAAISRVNADLQRKTMTLTLGKHALVVPLSRLGTQIDTAATREELQRVGKSGDFFTDLLQRVRARRGRLSVPLALRLDTARARSYL